MEWLTLAGFAMAVIAAGSTGAMFPPGDWYTRIEKPTWTPPDWLFPLAWTVLYAAIVYAAWRVSDALPAQIAAAGLAFWAAQIALNALWSPVFFGLHQPGAALIVLVGLWIAVAACVVLFLAIDTVAGLLMVPYLIWVSFAGALNYWIWRRNPSTLSGRTA
ncbi:MAG: TspO/MBR family protein [Pseudomonadota bacterium]